MKKTITVASIAAAMGAVMLSSTQMRSLKAQPAPTPNAPKATVQENAALLRYQLALDQLTLGNVTAARVIAEEARGRFGDTPEINLLLGYLLQREGRTTEARQRLVSVAARSSLASRFAAQLTAQPNSARRASTPSRVDSNHALASAITPASNDVTYLAGTPIRVGQSNTTLATLEQTMVRLINVERTKAGLSTLAWDATLAATARAHSADMRDRNYFTHEAKTPALREPIDRYHAVFKSTPSIIAENIYRSWGSPRRINQADIYTAHSALMNSPGHRSNIVQGRVTHIGIGIITNAKGDVWITQMFART